MEESKVPPEKIKVVDRRRFTDEGELRENAPAPRAPAASPAPPAPEVAAPEAPQSVPSDEPSPPAESVAATSSLFIELVATLAHQAELLIAGAEGLPAQPAEARRLIDYLATLEEKTEGNLSSEESQFLSNVTFQLRTMYMQSTR